MGPEGEPLFSTSLASIDVQTKLRAASVEEYAGLTHGSAMFRAEAYRQAGCYRPQFYFAQDVDLWIRMATLGDVWIIPEILCQMVIDVNTVSGRYRKQQIELLKIAVALRDSTESSERQEALLERASLLRPTGKRPPTGAEQARALYFIAACLRRRGDRRAIAYAQRALRANPLHLRSWFLLLRGV